MAKLSKTQQDVLNRMSVVVPGSAYALGCRLPTLRKLVALGYAKEVTPFGPGGMFSPQTHHKFKKVRDYPVPVIRRFTT